MRLFVRVILFTCSLGLFDSRASEAQSTITVNLQCPGTHNFGTTHTYTWALSGYIAQALGGSYSANFSFNALGVSFNAGVGSATYNYQNLISTGGTAMLASPSITGSCKKHGYVYAPGDTQWTFPPINDVSYGGTPSLIATAEEEVGICEDDEYRIAPSATEVLRGIVHGAIEDNGAMGLVAKGSHNVPGVHRAECTGYYGGGSGGGSPPDPIYILYCAWVDHYDENAQFLYSVKEGCWVEAQ
jgi:hypothetical protein